MKLQEAIMLVTHNRHLQYRMSGGGLMTWPMYAQFDESKLSQEMLDSNMWSVTPAPVSDEDIAVALEQRAQHTDDCSMRRGNVNMQDRCANEYDAGFSRGLRIAAEVVRNRDIPEGW